MAKGTLNEVHQQIKTSSCCICINVRTEPVLQHSANPAGSLMRQAVGMCCSSCHGRMWLKLSKARQPEGTSRASLQ